MESKLAAKLSLCLAQHLRVVSNLVAEDPRITVGGVAISVDTSNNAIFGGTMPAMFTISTSPSTPPMKNRVVNLNGGTIQLLSNGISVAGTTLTVCAPPITVSSVPIYRDSSILLVGTPSFSLATNDLNLLSTTTAGHEITAAPAPLNFGGTTISRGPPPMTIDGTLISFENSGELVAGSKMITLEGPGLSLGGLIIGGFGSQGPFSTDTPSPVRANSTVETGNGTSRTVQAFGAKAGGSERLIRVKDSCWDSNEYDVVCHDRIIYQLRRVLVEEFRK